MIAKLIQTRDAFNGLPVAKIAKRDAVETKLQPGLRTLSFKPRNQSLNGDLPPSVTYTSIS